MLRLVFGQTWRKVQGSAIRRNLTEDANAVTQYAKPLQWIHWGMGGGIVGCVGFVKAAQYTPSDSPQKGNYMFYHKSCGLLVLALLGPRYFYRATTRIPKPLAGRITLMLTKAPRWQELAGAGTHYALYGAITILPITGI